MRQNFERILLQTPTTVLVEPSSPNGCPRLISPREGIQNFLVLCRWGQLFISRVGYFIFFGNEFSDDRRNSLVDSLAKLDYQRTSQLWQNSLVIDDGNGNKKIIAQMAAIDKGFKIAVREVEARTGLKLK